MSHELRTINISTESIRQIQEKALSLVTLKIEGCVNSYKLQFIIENLNGRFFSRETEVVAVRNFEQLSVL